MRADPRTKFRLLALAMIIITAQCCCLIFPIRWRQQRTPNRQTPMLKGELATLRAPLASVHTAVFFTRPAGPWGW